MATREAVQLRGSKRRARWWQCRFVPGGGAAHRLAQQARRRGQAGGLLFDEILAALPTGVGRLVASIGRASGIGTSASAATEPTAAALYAGGRIPKSKGTRQS
jgi:hypothetical protein